MATDVAMSGLEAVNYDLQHKLREAYAENLALRERLSKYGEEIPAGLGQMTLGRIRALENVLDLARCHLARPDGYFTAELRDACMRAGRQP